MNLGSRSDQSRVRDCLGFIFFFFFFGRTAPGRDLQLLGREPLHFKTRGRRIAKTVFYLIKNRRRKEKGYCSWFLCFVCALFSR